MVCPASSNALTSLIKCATDVLDTCAPCIFINASIIAVHSVWPLEASWTSLYLKKVSVHTAIILSAMLRNKCAVDLPSILQDGKGCRLRLRYHKKCGDQHCQCCGRGSSSRWVTQLHCEALTPTNKVDIVKFTKARSSIFPNRCQLLGAIGWLKWQVILLWNM